MFNIKAIPERTEKEKRRSSKIMRGIFFAFIAFLVISAIGTFVYKNTDMYKEKKAAEEAEQQAAIDAENEAYLNWASDYISRLQDTSSMYFEGLTRPAAEFKAVDENMEEILGEGVSYSSEDTGDFSSQHTALKDHLRKMQAYRYENYKQRLLNGQLDELQYYRSIDLFKDTPFFDTWSLSLEADKEMDQSEESEYYRQWASQYIAQLTANMEGYYSALTSSTTNYAYYKASRENLEFILNEGLQYDDAFGIYESNHRELTEKLEKVKEYMALDEDAIKLGAVGDLYLMEAQEFYVNVNWTASWEANIID